MEGENKRLEEYSSGKLFVAAVRNLFKKKAVCLTVSAIAVVVSLFAMDIVSKYYGTAFWWVNCLFNLPFFSIFIAGVGGLVSNIGRFSVNRFIAASTASTIVMWALMALYNPLSMAWMPLDWAWVWKMFGLELFQHILLPITSLAIVLLPVMISAHRKKRRVNQQ